MKAIWKQPFRWYHGVAFYLLVQGITFGLAGIVSRLQGLQVKRFRDLFGDTNYFRSLKQVVITPPAGAFGPVWTINNISVIWGTLRVLNKPTHTEGRELYLTLQGLSWLNFVVFNAAYFSLRSPINAFVLTLSMMVLTVFSGFVALFKLRDSRVALSLATLFLWLLVALTAATFQVAWNHDELYDAGPFLEPVPALLKSQQK